MFTEKEKELYRAMSTELEKYNAEAWKSEDYRKFMNEKEEEVKQQFGAEMTLNEMRLAANSRLSPTLDHVRD